MTYDFDTEFEFGKYKRKTLIDILNTDPSYLDWCLINVDNFHIEDEVLILIKEIKPTFSLSEQARERQIVKQKKWEELLAEMKYSHDLEVQEQEFQDRFNREFYGEAYNPNDPAYRKIRHSYEECGYSSREQMVIHEVYEGSMFLYLADDN